MRIVALNILAASMPVVDILVTSLLALDIPTAGLLVAKTFLSHISFAIFASLLMKIIIWEQQLAGKETNILLKIANILADCDVTVIDIDRSFSSYIKTSFCFFTRKNCNTRATVTNIPAADL